jgi:hypothetical protein
MATTSTKIAVKSAPKQATGHGGARAGAGRKTDAELAEGVYAVFNRARAKERVYKAQIAEMKAKLTSGELVEVAKVKSEWSQIVTNVRSKLLTMPSKLAATALGAGTYAEMKELIDEAVHEVLQELSENA